jgi:hypothetical protein
MLLKQEEVDMLDINSTPQEILVWVETNNLDWFQRELDAGPQAFRYQILAALLADEKHGFEQKRIDGHSLF